MKRKICTAILLIGIFTFGYFYFEANTDSSPAALADDLAVETVAVQEEPSPPENPFEAYTYYNLADLNRYLEYRQMLPELDIETVLWHVNAGLDTEPYFAVSEVTGDHPLLVNKWHKLPEDYSPQELVTIHDGILATPGTAEAFGRMRAAAMQDGIFIEAAAGYRSFDKQKELFEASELYYGAEATEQSVARPGFGDHGTGRALHIVDRDYTYEGFDQLAEYAWLTQNCADYGFILRYGKDMADITGFDFEPYHFTFVGRDIALGMRESSIATLEEFVARGLAKPDGALIDDRPVVVMVAGYDVASDPIFQNDIVSRAKGYLEQENLRIVLTQDSGTIATEPKAALIIGLDKASHENDAVVWYAFDRPESLDLAETVCGRLSWAGFTAQGHGIYEDEKIAVASFAPAPAVLIELSAAKPHDSEKLAKAIADAVTAHLGIRKMYLTFDDGPSAKNTPEVLDILKEKGVKATFFVIGEMAEKNPELIKRIVAEGHAIGIHCYRHSYKELYSSVESFTEDFTKARNAIKEITGLEPVIYRFPGGSINQYNKDVYKQIVEEMDKQGFVYFDWNISVDDALGSVKPGTLIQNTQKSPHYRCAVLLMHDAYPHIAKELSNIIDSYSDYQMAVIQDDTEPVQF